MDPRYGCELITATTSSPNINERTCQHRLATRQRWLTRQLIAVRVAVGSPRSFILRDVGPYQLEGEYAMNTCAAALEADDVDGKIRYVQDGGGGNQCARVLARYISGNHYGVAPSSDH